MTSQRTPPDYLPFVYVCHPFTGDEAGNAAQVQAICRVLTAEPVVPIAPQLYLPQFLDEATERERALTLCLQLIGLCDELRVYSSEVSEGMIQEIGHARTLGVPVRFVEI